MYYANRKLISELAENIDCGNDCYYNFKTDEIIAIPNFSQFSDEEELGEALKMDLKRVTKNKADYIKIEVLQNFESFKIMECFINQIRDKKSRLELEKTLQKKKPFQNFKNLIDNSVYRQKWFDFKKIELEKIVENQLKQWKA